MDIQEILKKHNLWVRGEAWGSRANLSNANLRGADLRGADLAGANIDFTQLPLSCKGLHWKIDKKIACQLLYHIGSMTIDDEEFTQFTKSPTFLKLANEFHRVKECGRLE